MQGTPSIDFKTELSRQLCRLQSYSLKLCRNPDEAEDLIQDTVLRALCYEQSFALGTNMHAWLCKIMHSIFISARRRAANERRAVRRLSDDPNAWTQSECACEPNELSPPVQAALSGLKDPFKKVIRLVDLHELSYNQAARHLQVPVGTVMSRLSRGRRQLAVALAATGSPEAPAVGGDPPVAA